MVAAYRDTGVIILHDFVSTGKCARLKRRALELVAGFDPAEVRSVFSTTQQEQLHDSYFIDSGDKIRFFLENDAFDANGELRHSKEHSLNKMGHAMHDLDPEFDAFSRTPELAEVARRIGLEDPVLLQSMYIFKPPRIGGEVVCHQDSTYIYTEPESCVGFWFALEDATLENGCMQFIPGAHRMPLKKRNYRRPDGMLVTETLDDTPWPEERRVAAEAPAGTLVVFDGRAPHLSATNLSASSRHAYTLHVIDRTCHYPAENWLQRSADLPLRGFDGET
ncbi:MAG: phytanoyl-CoA dioxygenase family protein [Gammaproteobacteria bacterium]|nr:phytanoyl-CoA dioxygenase family protein [Gammaproteobacteria bacterium]